MAKLAINILIENRKKIEKDERIYPAISILLHFFLIALLFFLAGYSRYKALKKPKIYKVSIATLPSLKSGTKGNVTNRKNKSKSTIVAKKKRQPVKKRNKKKAKKEKKTEGINTNKKKKTNKNQKLNNTNKKTKGFNGVKTGFSSNPSSLMDLDSTSFNYSYYLAIVRDKIGENWIRTYTGYGKVKIYFKIMRNGEIRDAKVEVSSGNAGLDRLALEAVLKSNPLPPLPEDFREDYIGIHIWFNYEE